MKWPNPIVDFLYTKEDHCATFKEIADHLIDSKEVPDRRSAYVMMYEVDDSGLIFMNWRTLMATLSKFMVVRLKNRSREA